MIWVKRLSREGAKAASNVHGVEPTDVTDVILTHVHENVDQFVSQFSQRIQGLAQWPVIMP